MTEHFTMADYWMGRDATCPTEMTPAIETNARRTVLLVNRLLDQAALHGVIPPLSPITHTIVASGWRPPSVNASTPNAATRSLHMTGAACDIYDPEGILDNWLLGTAGTAALESIGLWAEHPACTKNWCHLQITPPRSGNRFFYP